MTLAEFRRDQEAIVKKLENAKLGLKVVVLGAEGDKGTGVPRMFKVRRMMTLPDGTLEYVNSGVLVGRHAMASLISTARNEKASAANYAQFALPVMLSIQTPASGTIQK